MISNQQMKILAFPYTKYDALICDGAVRSGKTSIMMFSFVEWAMENFNGQRFGVCGKTVDSCTKNIITPFTAMSLAKERYTIKWRRSEKILEIRKGSAVNWFEVFGGKDESSASLIQGRTLAGVLLDVVALMPRSFVEQALARCSVEGAKMWFSCNPNSPRHWFYVEWIKKAKEKHALYVHFTMDDNPSLSESLKERYKRLYSGTFYERFVLGKWTASQGVVYPMFSEKKHVYSGDMQCEKYVISCDYGTVNPSSFGLWGLSDGVWYRLKEYYYSSKREGISRTDEEHYTALEQLAGDRDISKIIVDPSAASFIECIRRHGRFRVVKAENDVISGIRNVSTALGENRLRFHESCRDIIREFHLYSWNEKSGTDVPIKENDHAMDDMRYFVADIMKDRGEDEFFALSVSR